MGEIFYKLQYDEQRIFEAPLERTKKQNKKGWVGWGGGGDFYARELFGTRYIQSQPIACLACRLDTGTHFVENREISNK